jgi:diguanylate cyclase (GGDEF)-like protein
MTRKFDITKDTHRRVASSYILAFGVIAVCLVTMFLTVHWTLQSQKDSVRMVDLSGRQRTLSQGIALASQQLVTAEDSSAAAEARTMLSNARDRFAESNRSLSAGEVHPDLAETLHGLYAGEDGLDRQSVKFVADVDRLLVMTPGDPARHELSQQIVHFSNRELVRKLDRVSGCVEAFSAQRIHKTRQTVSALFLITLIVLVLEAVFIFQPILQANQKIDWAANHDPLTGLPNRRFLAQKAAAALAESKLNHTAIGFMHIDLDAFKSVNDTLGHGAGDEVLRRVAERLRNNLRPEQTIARIGGDEFAVLFTNVRDADELVGPAKRLIDRLGEPVPYEDMHCNVGCSIGLAISGADESDFERVLMDADIALYEAKNNGRNQFQLINDGLRGRFARREQIYTEIRAGIERGEFVPFFQPQFDSHSGRCTGVEALARWLRPNGVLEKNAEFIQLADEIGLLGEIDSQILEKSLAAFVRWREQGHDIPRLALNFSMREIETHDFVTRLASTVVGFGLRASDISIELLESVCFDIHNRIVVKNINALSHAGFRIELDDFGTGHAAVTSLLDMPIDRIKLDGTLIRDLENGGAGETITRTLIRLADELNIETLAEGVETEQQVEVLCGMGCLHHQGYYYARPMSEQAFSEWLSYQRTGSGTSTGVS